MKPSGMAIVEALVATSLLTLGLLGASRLTLRALDAALQTRHQEQAQSLAREALDCAVSQTQPCPAAESITRQGMAYTVQMQHLPRSSGLTEISVQIAWRSSAGPQQLIWHTRRSDLPDWLGVSSP